MKIPNTYSDWMECFDIAKAGTQDAEVLDCIRKGNLTLSAGVAGRFAAQLKAVVQFRIKKASDKFDRAMKLNGGDVNLLSASLLALRKEFAFLIQFVRIPVLPGQDVELLVNAIKDQASTIQKTLEASSSKMDRTGMITSIIRKNNIDKLEGL
jgi:hypothetical protein